jgi:hypothetical protein
MWKVLFLPCIVNVHCLDILILELEDLMFHGFLICSCYQIDIEKVIGVL